MSAPHIAVATCPECRKPEADDVFAGEGGATKGLMDAGFCVTAVDNDANRLRYNPAPHKVHGDAIEYILNRDRVPAFTWTSPTCTGYSRGTVAIPDRLAKYDRLIAVTREALLTVGGDYVIENVEDAKSELRLPLTLCAFEFNLTAVDDDGTKLYMKRHRLFESSILLLGAGGCSGHARSTRIAGSYGGARRDKVEAREIRKGGYVPSLAVMRQMLGTPWMTEKGCQLSIPPAYSEFIGRQVIDHLSEAAA